MSSWQSFLTHRTSVFIRRSMLVRLNFVRPLFCISLVSGPAWKRDTVGIKWQCNRLIIKSDSYRHRRTHTCEYDEAVAALCVAQDAAPQQHVLIAQAVLALPPVQSATEAVQLVIGGLTDHLPYRQTEDITLEGMWTGHRNRSGRYVNITMVNYSKICFSMCISEIISAARWIYR